MLGTLTELCMSLLNTHTADGQTYASCWISVPTLTKTCQRWWLIRPVSLSSVCPVSLPNSTSTPSPLKRLACIGWPKVQRSAVSLCKGEKLLIAYIMVWLHVNTWFVIVYQFFSVLAAFSCVDRLIDLILKWLKKIANVSKSEQTCSCFSPPALFIVMWF